MSRDGLASARSQILAFWRTAELFSPQDLPKVTRRSSDPHDTQVIDWERGDPLPWEYLPPPRPTRTTRRVWRHRVYLGVYEFDGVYETLHRVFADDADAYDERPRGLSAAAGLVVDHDRRVIVDTAMLSSALWGVGRANEPGPADAEWIEGFDDAAKEFVSSVDDYQATLRDKAAAKEPPPCDGDSLLALVRLAQRCAGVAGISGLEQLVSSRVRIESAAVSANRPDDAVENTFLNSFFLDDLALVRDRVEAGEIGAALGSYLTPDGDIDAGARIDVVSTPGAVDAATSLRHLPEGRWPSNPSHGLALSQQFAVNQALGAFASSTGVMGVNGPPGTGKTTMLRDILAGNVVERAHRLAALENPGEAFIDLFEWTAETGHPRKVPQLRADLTGFEMVVASANNAAVENVSTEIPMAAAIDERWRQRRGYFTDLATAILRETSETPPDRDTSPLAAWALVAATLGKKSNRSKFRNSFWFAPEKPERRSSEADADDQSAVAPELTVDAVPRMQDILQGWDNGKRPRKPWGQARQEFRAAESRVHGLLAQRRAAEDRLAAVAALTSQVEALTATIAQVMGEQVQLAATQRTLHTTLRNHSDAHHLLQEQHDRILAVRPRALEAILSLGRANRTWRHQLAPVLAALTASEDEARRLSAEAQDLEHAEKRLQDRLASAETDLEHARAAVESNRAQRTADERRYGASYPGPLWTGDRRELHAPWLDAELDEARSELFLAALTLHEDFIAANASRMVAGLRAAIEVVAGACPHGLEEHKRRAAWQLFFLVVPLVSTTFASASRMLEGLGSEAIGWLLIDEAGQACPQYAAGAIWRAKRVVAVGDPLQLPPVASIPQKAQRDIARHYGVSSTWLAPKASVQTLADRIASHGTYLDQGEQHVWVSAPLRVHRRCDDPMFTVSNQIAYNGLMVNGVHRRKGTADEPDPFGPGTSTTHRIAASHWAHEPADQPGSHLQPRQIQRLEKAIAYLTALGIAEADIIAISPFRAVADRLKSLCKERYPGMRAGTIHTAQGREAPVVILVLGGDPDNPGAKAWASSTPNLVNVAVSRAQRRLYVIGDRDAWAQHIHFRELAAHLAGPAERT